MDPSLSISTDPHHPPPQFAPFPYFSGPAVANPGNPVFFGASVPASTANNHVSQAPLNTVPGPLPPHPSFNHPPYAEMICSAIVALNESDGSSKQAISRYIEQVYSGLPSAHTSLLTHHLKSLKNSGVLVMVKKSYKFASVPPLAGVASASTTLEAPRSDLLGNTTNEQQLMYDLTGASAPPKRGRGRPPKPKPEQNTAEPVVQSNGQPVSDPNAGPLFLSASEPAEEAQTVKRRPGRPRKNGTPQAMQATLATGTETLVLKRRGRPPGRRGPGRLRKPKSVTAPATVFSYAADGPKRRGRPKRVESVAGMPLAAADGGGVVMSSGKRRGRPPKIGGVISKLMKPKRSTGRPVGRPRKTAQWPTREVSESQAASAYGELKRKLEFFQEKIKEVVGVLRSEVAGDNQVAASAITELQGLVAMDINEPQAEEAQAQELQARAESESEAEAQAEAMREAQTQAEAMQEALF